MNLPLYTPLTHDLIAQYLPDSLALLVFLGNTIIWAVPIWLGLKTGQKRKITPPQIPAE